MEIEGENVCRECGAVLGYSEVQSVNSWQTHNIGIFGNNQMSWLIFRLSNNLNLPPYASQTILQTATRINKVGITKKKAIFYATVYACRIHKIPRLLTDIFSELEKSTQKSGYLTENTLLKILNRISKNLANCDVSIRPPDKEYYLQAYLAKIQDIIIKETDHRYFEILRSRSIRNLSSEKSDPSAAAKKAILACTSTILQTKIRHLM